MTKIPEALLAEFDEIPEAGTEDKMYGYRGTPIGYLKKKGLVQKEIYPIWIS